MRCVALCGGLAALVVFALTYFTTAAEPEVKSAHVGKVRHVVLFKYKEGTPKGMVQKIEDEFRALGEKIPFIVDFECGTNCSPEGLSKGLSACFLVTFQNEKDRDRYLPHRAHKEFVSVLEPHLDDVLVVDYVVRD